MKTLILNILLLTACAVLADIEADSGELGDHHTSFYSSQASHSVINSNGNSVVVSRRFNSKGEEENYISIASPKIRIDGDYFTCNSLTCPTEAFKCHITSEAIADDRNNMKTISECQDHDGKVLESKETIEENPYPKEDPPYSRVALVDRDGSISIQDSNNAQSFTSLRKKLTKEEQEKLEKDIAEQHRLAQEHLKQQMEELNSHLNKLFGPNAGFPFGNAGGSPFGPNFPFGNSNPFGAYFPFGGNSYPVRGSSSFDSIGDDANFGFNINWPFASSSFGFYPYRPYRPPVTNQYPYYPQPQNPQIPNPDDHNLPESFNTNNNNRNNLTPVIPQRPLQSEIETNTVYDAENELIEATTYRGYDNRVNNYYDKYRYAHEY